MPRSARTSSPACVTRERSIYEKTSKELPGWEPLHSADQTRQDKHLRVLLPAAQLLCSSLLKMDGASRPTKTAACRPPWLPSKAHRVEGEDREEEGSGRSRERATLGAGLRLGVAASPRI